MNGRSPSLFSLGVAASNDGMRRVCFFFPPSFEQAQAYMQITSFSYYVVLVVRPLFYFFIFCFFRMKNCNLSRLAKTGKRHSVTTHLLLLLYVFFFLFPFNPLFFQTEKKAKRENGSYRKM